jgi:hypothetical protein
MVPRVISRRDVGRFNELSFINWIINLSFRMTDEFCCRHFSLAEDITLPAYHPNEEIQRATKL